MDTMNHTLSTTEVAALIDSARMGFSEEVFTTLFGAGYNFNVRHVLIETDMLGTVNVDIYSDDKFWTVSGYAHTVNDALIGALTAWMTGEPSYVVK